MKYENYQTARISSCAKSGRTWMSCGSPHFRALSAAERLLSVEVGVLDGAFGNFGAAATVDARRHREAASASIILIQLKPE